MSLRKFNVFWNDDHCARGQVFSNGNHLGDVWGVGWNPKTKTYCSWIPIFRCVPDDRIIQVVGWADQFRYGCASLELICWVLLISTTKQENCLVVTERQEREAEI